MDQVQLTMLQLDSVPVVVKKRKNPEPQHTITTPLKKYEILHRPFDLRFRGKINAWLGKIKTDSIALANIIDKEKVQLIGLYFMPHRKRWLNQAQVCRKLNRSDTRRLSTELRDTLLLIWDKTH